MGDLKTERLAIVMVDAYKLPPLIVMNIDQEISHMADVLAEAERQSIPVFEIVTADPDHPATPAEKSHPQLTRYRGDHWRQIIKPSFDAFDRTNLLDELRRVGVSEIILMGFNQTTCVRMTAESARLQGFLIYTSFDIMQGMSSGYCEVIQADGVVNLEGPSNCDFSNAKTNLEIRPVEFIFESAREFYKKNTVLVDSYRDLPIFWKKICQK